MSTLRSLSHAEIDGVCGAGPEGGCVDPNPGPKTLDEIVHDILYPPSLLDLLTIN